MFDDADRYFMTLALQEAKTALVAGDFPIGAALTVDGLLWGTGRNTLFSENRTSAHAEHTLINQHTTRLRQTVRSQTAVNICLYTTLEPCLMCLGISVMHRITRIVIACPDPTGGVTKIDNRQLGTFYQRWWPTFEVGLFKEASYELIVQFLQTGKIFSWQMMLNDFKQMQQEW